MSKETQHRLLSDRSPAAIGTAQAELNRLRGHVAPRSTPSIAPSPAKSSFRKAREHTASALEILERNKK